MLLTIPSWPCSQPVRAFNELHYLFRFGRPGNSLLLERRCLDRGHTETIDVWSGTCALLPLALRRLQSGRVSSIGPGYSVPVAFGHPSWYGATFLRNEVIATSPIRATTSSMQLAVLTPSQGWPLQCRQVRRRGAPCISMKHRCHPGPRQGADHRGQTLLSGRAAWTGQLCYWNWRAVRRRGCGSGSSTATSAWWSPVKSLIRAGTGDGTPARGENVIATAAPARPTWPWDWACRGGCRWVSPPPPHGRVDGGQGREASAESAANSPGSTC